MTSRMTIGDFSRATKLSAKTLRFYHQAGILLPAEIDPDNGYRWYGLEQIVDAQVVSRLRSLEVPIETIRGILTAPDVSVRNQLVAEHLQRLEVQLEATRAAVVSLRGLLEPVPTDLRIEHRSLAEEPALIIRSVIDLAELGGWYSAAWRALDEAVAAADARATGPRGGIWGTDLFLLERGEAALFQPVESLPHAVASLADASAFPGRVMGEMLPAVDVAVLSHRGADETMAQSYGILGAYVARHEIGVDGPIRENYLPATPEDPTYAVTEICWPIFRASR